MVQSHLWMNVHAAIRDPRMRVLGLTGTYQKYGLDVQEEALANGMRPGDPDWGREPADAWGRLVTDDGERTVETEAGGVRAVLRRRRRGAALVQPAARSTRSKAWGCCASSRAAFDSARSGSVVPFEPR